MRWYRNAVSRLSAVHCDALLLISVMNSVSIVRQYAECLNSHGVKHVTDDRLMYLADFLSELPQLHYHYYYYNIVFCLSLL